MLQPIIHRWSVDDTRWSRSNRRQSQKSLFLPQIDLPQIPPSEYCHNVWFEKAKMVWLPDGKKWEYASREYTNMHSPRYAYASPCKNLPKICQSEFLACNCFFFIWQDCHVNTKADVSSCTNFDPPGVTPNRGMRRFLSNYFDLLLYFFLCTQNLSTDLELRPLNRFWYAIHQQTRIHAG